MKSEPVQTTPMLSIVIPAYNASKDIVRTLDSLEDQTAEPERYEIILVDDGSTDHTLELCRQYEARYANLTVIHKANGGVSSARNAGIDAAKGKWIAFVDSDDYVTKDYVESMTTLWPEQDLVIFDNVLERGAERFLEKGWLREYFEREADISQVLLWICENRINLPTDKRFTMEVLRKYRIRFLDGVNMGEDLLFNFQYALHVPCAFVSQRPIYIHTDNPEGLCHRKVTERRLFEYETVYRHMQLGCDEGGLGDEHRRAIHAAFLRMTARYAGQLRTSGFSAKSITAMLRRSDMVQNLLLVPAATGKDRLRKFFLRARLYHLCAAVLKYR